VISSRADVIITFLQDRDSKLASFIVRFKCLLSKSQSVSNMRARILSLSELRENEKKRDDQGKHGWNQVG